MKGARLASLAKTIVAVFGTGMTTGLKKEWQSYRNETAVS